MTIWFAHCFVPGPGYGLVCPVLSSRARACRRDHQAPSAPLPDVGVTFVRETYPASCGDITPRSSLLRAHVPIPCGSPLLRFFTSFEESLQVATSPCCHRVGIEIGRARCRWRVTALALSIARRVIAVGIPVARYPPLRSVRALLSAYGSYLGWLAAKRTLG